MVRRNAVTTGAAAPLVLTLLTGLLVLMAALAFAQGEVDVSTLPKGIGPIEQVELGPIDEAVAAEGKTVFETYCASCHKFGERYVGPDLAGVTQRRAPEWILNMILNPEEMVFSDDTAYELLAEYMTQMPLMPVTEDQAFAILEYFRVTDANQSE
jgi:mono/diheme cytochrome c family protein